jgi:hypothetical protein
MRDLNYFLRYDKGTEHHEDHLTRAFLVLLRHSTTIMQYFYSYVQQKATTEKDNPLKPLHNISIKEVSFQTQVGSLPEAHVYVSILITNSATELTEEIVCVDRIPVYDGVIDIDSNIVFFIETKPNRDHVWEKQLCPARKDIPEGSVLHRKAIVLEWKEIINSLHAINESNLSDYRDKILITDFFELVNSQFDYLNPYNDLSKCQSEYLATKRIEQLLKEIVHDEDRVKYHTGWGLFIEVYVDEIRKIGLLLNKNENRDWTGITIAADFGSTVGQARAFYSNVPTVDFIKNIPDFDAYCNLHLAFTTKNLVHFHSPENSLEKYFNYWKSDVWDNFGGVPKEKLEKDYLQEYVDEGILIYDQAKKEEVKEVIMDKGYQRINICPAIYVEHFISREDAMRMDKLGDLKVYVVKKMRDAVGILNHDWNKVFKV